MCGEFYPGWFDTWGAPHHTGNTPRLPAGSGNHAEAHGSFSIYMAHGGTTFGLWSGADRPFKPDTSSYDYDAPISEAGWVTEKFHKTRELFSRTFARRNVSGKSRLPIPSPPSRWSRERRRLHFATCPRRLRTPRNMEAYNQGYGCILYRTTVPAGRGPLEVAAIPDFGFVFLDGKSAGIFDRRQTGSQSPLPARTSHDARHPRRTDGPHQFRRRDERSQRSARPGEIRRRRIERLEGFQFAAR